MGELVRVARIGVDDDPASVHEVTMANTARRNAMGMALLDELTWRPRRIPAAGQ
jgi:hypothetical protein